MSAAANLKTRLPFAVPEICFGTSPLGSMPDTYGYEVSEEQARAALDAILDQPVSFMDSSRNYGMGRSEARIGAALKARGGLPAGAILSTKLDRDMNTRVLDAERARRSVEESLEALGLDKLHLLHLHDPEHCASIDDITKAGGALDELFKMKEEGLVQAVGLAMGTVSLQRKILPDWEFDAIINHNRYTLLNREADEMYSEAHARGIAILNAAPFAGGVLVKGSAKTKRITYQDATEDQLAPVRAIEEICARHNMPMGAAALQFSMRDERISSTIVGVSKPERVQQMLDWAALTAPDGFWDEIMALPFSTEDPEANREYRPG